MAPSSLAAEAAKARDRHHRDRQPESGLQPCPACYLPLTAVKPRFHTPLARLVYSPQKAFRAPLLPNTSLRRRTASQRGTAHLHSALTLATTSHACPRQDGCKGPPKLPTVGGAGERRERTRRWYDCCVSTGDWELMSHRGMLVWARQR